MTDRWKNPHARCRYCDKLVRLRKDGRLARHQGVNRHGQSGWRCVGSLHVIRP